MNLRWIAGWVALWVAGAAWAEPHVVGIYTGSYAPGVSATDGEGPYYHVDVRGLDTAGIGSVLVAFRRVPSARGDAEFRDDPVWMEAGRLEVLGQGEGWVTARMVAGPPFPIPALDDDGLPGDRVCIGDRVVETGSAGVSAEAVVGHFEQDLLFPAGSHVLHDDGLEVMRVWLSRFAVGGSVRIDVGIRGERKAVEGRRPATRERLARADGPAGAGRAVVHGTSEQLAVAQRRAARLGRLVAEALEIPGDRVLATTSWADEGVTASRTVTVRLLDAVPLAEMTPGAEESEDGAPLAQVGPGGEGT